MYYNDLEHCAPDWLKMLKLPVRCSKALLLLLLRWSHPRPNRGEARCHTVFSTLRHVNSATRTFRKMCDVITQNCSPPISSNNGLCATHADAAVFLDVSKSLAASPHA